MTAHAGDIMVANPTTQMRTSNILPYMNKGLTVNNVYFVPDAEGNKMGAHIIGRYDAMMIIHESFDIQGIFDIGLKNNNFYLSDFHITDAAVNGEAVDITKNKNVVTKLENAINTMMESIPLYSLPAPPATAATDSNSSAPPPPAIDENNITYNINDDNITIQIPDPPAADAASGSDKKGSPAMIR